MQDSSDDAELSSSPGARAGTPPQSPLTYLAKNPNLDPDLDQFAVKSATGLFFFALSLCALFGVDSINFLTILSQFIYSPKVANTHIIQSHQSPN